MPFDRPYAEYQDLGDLLVAETAADQLEHVAFARRESIRRDGRGGFGRKVLEERAEEFSRCIGFGDGAKEAEAALGIASLGDCRLGASELGEHAGEGETGSCEFVRASGTAKDVACVFE